jgi:O-antigen ligase
VADVSSKPRIPIALGIAILSILFQDTLNTVFHVQGEVTILIAVILGVIGLSTLVSPRPAMSRRAVPVPMQLFVVWAVVRLAMEPTETGLQNVLVWFIFPATIGVVYARAETGTFERSFPWWKWMAVLAAVVYLLEVRRDGIGTGEFPYSARGAGWFCVLVFVILVPVTFTKKLSWWPSITLLLAITLSLSRTPLAIAALLLIVVVALRPFRKTRPAPSRVLGRLLVMTSVVAVGAYLLVTRVSFIQDRFTEGDGFSFGGVEINSSGRSVLWGLTLQQWRESPWIGHGPGAAQIMITSHFPGWIAHPHNEYLRILDDTGIVGMALWGLGMIFMLVRTARAVARTSDVADRALHIGALLSVLVLLLGSITDNLTISVYCVMIAGSMIGLSAQRANHQFRQTSVPRPFARIYAADSR